MKATIETIRIALGGAEVHGDLALPPEARGMVLFAHGSGSSRHSPRNQAVAARLNQEGFGTLLLDLLTEAEEARDAWTGELRFDIGLLTGRLVDALDRLANQPRTAGLPLGLFGASTGAAGALAAAAARPDLVRAVVSRGGRPDLAPDALPRVRAPVLLIVGGRDEVVVDLNRSAAGRLNGPHEVVVVPGASHLFEEPGTLERVAELAAHWFRDYLPRRGPD
ncbi:dienelactone hydrolase family protein [Thermopolyspora sp. NPDC052614]|uniref:dienelactone hydrolase family protein n=1 Tax=Thermopolyspora sp. NPDC052614 TaxID=3155682 RepID=UPI003441AD45